VSADLVAKLETPLPASLPAGRATAVFLYGICFHRRDAVAELAILVDREPHRPAAAGMPRPDVFAEHGDAGAFRSAFWGTAPVAARLAGGAVELALAVRLRGGGEQVAPLGHIDVVEPAPSRPAEPGLIAVCMATFEPDMALFRVQLESLRAQTDRHWTCVISDDGSNPERFAAIEATLAGDPRFALSRSGRRLGFYRNFERALALAPPQAELLALCDQDDRWHPEKLAVLRSALGRAQLVYSDQRLVDADGRVLRDTLWRGRRNNHTDLTSMLVANTITGAATLFRRDVAERALPFPDTPGLQFHDHWIGLVALASGDVAYVDRPLYDYVQHGGAFFGDLTHGGRRSVRERLRGLVRGGRGAYFRGYLARAVQAQVLLARCGDVLTPRKRRALERFVAADSSLLALGWLAGRPLRVLAGRTETLGSESGLVRGLLWRRLVRLLATGSRAPSRRPLDASLPGLLSFQQERLRRWRARV
jgi:glycosyltransferase involved in cell wall biosynthesis